MDKLEKVIRGLECCILRDPDDHARCSQCSYGGNCVNRLKMDALELLKAQEPVEPERAGYPDASRVYGTWYYICGACGEAIDYKDKFCRGCGRKVKWDG